MKRMSLRIIPLLFFFILALFLWRGLSLDPHKLPSVQLGKSLPNFTLGQLNNPKQTFNSTQLRNQVVLLNVWASWCEACVEEQVFMMQLAREGVAIYGLNYKDNSDNAAQWLTEWGNPYKLVLADKEGKVAIDLGVYGAPETFLIDKKGIIRYRHVGVMTQEIWTQDILPLKNKLEQDA